MLPNSPEVLGLRCEATAPRSLLLLPLVPPPSPNLCPPHVLITVIIVIHLAIIANIATPFVAP
eukprot:192987-Pyramimonas_sp.AAC.1